MPVKPILMLGHPGLYLVSAPVSEPASERDLQILLSLVQDLRDTLEDFRIRRGEGQAISAPQIGVRMRVIFCPLAPFSGAVFNPIIDPFGPSVEVWEGCLSFPGLYVKVRRRTGCKMMYRDLEWRERAVTLTGEASIIAQHECDHLEGILSVARAADARSFSLIRPWASDHRGSVLRPGRA